MLASCRPLGVEVYELTEPSVLESWKPPEPPAYRGLHGMVLPVFQANHGEKE
jgi:hypothetical protein